MKKKNVIMILILIASAVYGTWQHGFLHTIENMSTALTWYFIAIGAINFLLWLHMYLAYKRLQKNPTFYLALLREAFATTK